MSKPNLTTSLPEIVERLSAFFPAEDVKSFPMTVKRDKTAALAAFYIDARAVQNRLDETCYWRNEFVEDPRGSGKSILAGISILVELPDGSHEWLSRWDGADNTDIEATKGGLSGAMRRAAVNWGIGRYLYNVPGQWVDMKEGGKYFAKTPRIPSQFLPNASRARAAQQDRTPSAPSAVAPKAAAGSKLKLSAAQTAQFREASNGRDRAAVKPIYTNLIAGTVEFADALEQVSALPTV